MHYIFLILVVFFIGGCTGQPTACVSKQELINKSYDELGVVAKSIKNQETSMNEFSTFVGIMKNYVSDYSKTIQASAYFSNALRVLPIPYAGEISNATKLVSNSLVNLNNTATAINSYKQSSSNFIKGYNQLNPNSTPSEIAKLAKYADDKLIIDALKLEGNMEQISKTTEALVSVTQMVSNSSSSAFDYLGKAKSLLGNDEVIPLEDKNKIAKSSDGFKASLIQLNNHISSLKNSAITNRQNISKARVISDLAVELDSKK